MRSKGEGGRARKGEAGMSLVEATVILAVMAALTSIMAPVVGGYVSDAKQTTALKDVETIGTAIERMLTDVGETEFLRDGNGASATATPSHALTNRVDLLVSDGNTPTVSVPRGAGTDWNAAVDDAAVQKLEYYLVTDTPSNTAANAYRTPSDMSVLAQFDPDSGATYNSEYAWRGAYLPGTVGADPWGYRYGVNVEFLAHPLTVVTGTPTGNVNDVLVLSAGPSGIVDTQFAADGSTTGGNDITYRVSGGTR